MSRKQIAKDAKIKNSKIVCEDVKIESGVKLNDVYIKAKKIKIKSNAMLTGCKIFSKGLVELGKNSIIKENSVLNAFKGISIGDRTIIDRDVVIGGMQSEQSEIEIGNDCAVLFRSYVNTTRKISIGNRVGIGGYCLIFTHSSWQNVLEGNPYKFAKVIIEDNVWLPWHVTVFPGVIIGKNSTIGSGSIVTKNIPPKVFAAGIPAKIIKKKNVEKLSKSKKNSIASEIVKDFGAYAKEFLEIQNIIKKDSQNCTINFKNKRLIYATNFKNIKPNDVVVSLKIPIMIKKNYEWIDLDSETAKITSDIGKQFLAFIKRYGIRIIQ